MSANPLTEIRFQIPFDQIKAEHVEPAVEELLAESRANVDALAEDDGPRTFENTLLALEDATEKLGFAMGVVGHLEGVRTTDELRTAYNNVQPAVSAFSTSIGLNPKICAQLKRFAATEEAQSLSPLRARFLRKTLDDFRRSGADLSDEGKKRLEQINIDLTELTVKFSQNVLDATNAFELIIEDEDNLAGLPPTAREMARESAKSKDKAGWRFTLQAPSYSPLMTHLDDGATRERAWRAYNTRASEGEWNNREIIVKVLALRAEKAQLLGYADFADFILEERMAKSGGKAQQFLSDLRSRTKAAFERENEELDAYRKSIEGPEAPPIEPWDVAYYAEKLRQSLYEFEEEQLKPYFPYESVKKGMFELVEKLYGVRVVEQDDLPGWHPDVQAYRLVDTDGAHLGSFYADYFPREDKRPGAWMDAFLTGRKLEAGWEPHLGLMCGNLNPPVGEKPALLSHNDVETLFHEFGHLLHHLLSRVEIRSLAGTNVAWDFVELPSQIMENWCWERDALDLFARHWETGERIPEDLFQKMVRGRNFRAANHQMRQLSFGTLDLALHVDYNPETDGDPVSYANSIAREFVPAPLPDDYSMLTAFSHLFSSPVAYAAAYYSYKWSEALDADAFSRFAKEGIFSDATGRSFRETILSKGDSEEPEVLFRKFMGRDPDPEALLVRLGLATASYR